MMSLSSSRRSLLIRGSIPVGVAKAGGGVRAPTSSASSPDSGSKRRGHIAWWRVKAVRLPHHRSARCDWAEDRRRAYSWRHFSGFLAWWLWRTVYLSKLPRLEKKVRVALGWSLDLFFSKDLVQLKTNDATVCRGGAVKQQSAA